MNHAGPTKAKALVHYAWVVTGVTCFALLAVAGVRSSFGVFVQPLQHEFGWDRAAISVTAVLSMLLTGRWARWRAEWPTGTARSRSCW